MQQYCINLARKLHQNCTQKGRGDHPRPFKTNQAHGICRLTASTPKRAAAASAISSCTSIPTALYPSRLAAANVLPAPANGSRIRPPGAVICTICLMISTGFCVWCMRSFPCTLVARNTPGRQGTPRPIGNGPLLAQRINSACWRNRPRWGLDVFLSHTATPRMLHPAHCTASDKAGRFRQSINMANTAPGFAFSRADSRIIRIKWVHDRWSMLSPQKSGKGQALFDAVYLTLVAACLADNVLPPLEYGGSVITASKVPISCCKTSRAFPLYIFISAIKSPLIMFAIHSIIPPNGKLSAHFPRRKAGEHFPRPLLLHGIFQITDCLLYVVDCFLQVINSLTHCLRPLALLE